MVVTDSPPQWAGQPRTVHLLSQGAGSGAPRGVRYSFGWLAIRSQSTAAAASRTTPLAEHSRVVLEQLGAVRLVQEGQLARPRRRLEQDWPGWRGQCRSHPVSIWCALETLHRSELNDPVVERDKVDVSNSSSAYPNSCPQPGLRNDIVILQLRFTPEHDLIKFEMFSPNLLSKQPLALRLVVDADETL